MLLFDQNLSFKIVSRLEEDYPNSIQVRNVGLKNASDREIWKYAKKHHLIIVTFDADFYDLSVVWGFPPKIIWIRSLNQTTQAAENLLKQHKENIISFIENSDLACLEIIMSAPDPHN